MAIRGKFFATLRDVKGKREGGVDIQGERVDIQNLMRFLFGKQGEAFKNFGLESETGNVRKHTKIKFSSRNIGQLGGLKTKVKEGEVIHISQNRWRL